MSKKSAALLAAIKEYDANKWKVIGQKVGKPAKVRCGLFRVPVDKTSIDSAANTDTRHASNTQRRTLVASIEGPMPTIRLHVPACSYDAPGS